MKFLLFISDNPVNLIKRFKDQAMYKTISLLPILDETSLSDIELAQTLMRGRKSEPSTHDFNHRWNTCSCRSFGGVGRNWVEPQAVTQSISDQFTVSIRVSGKNRHADGPSWFTDLGPKVLTAAASFLSDTKGVQDAPSQPKQPSFKNSAVSRVTIGHLNTEKSYLAAFRSNYVYHSSREFIVPDELFTLPDSIMATGNGRWFLVPNQNMFSEFWVLDAKTGTQTQVSLPQKTSVTFSFYNVFLFEVFDDDRSNSRFSWLFNPETNQLHEITMPGGRSLPRLSKDGNYVFWHIRDSDDLLNVTMMNIHSGKSFTVPIFHGIPDNQADYFMIEEREKYIVFDNNNARHYWVYDFDGKILDSWDNPQQPQISTVQIATKS